MGGVCLTRLFSDSPACAVEKPQCYQRIFGEKFARHGEKVLRMAFAFVTGFSPSQFLLLSMRYSVSAYFRPFASTFGALALVLACQPGRAQSAAQAEVARRSQAAAAYNAGQQAFAAGKFAEAAAQIEKSISLCVDPIEQQQLGPAWFTLGAAYFNVPNYPKAIETFKAYIQKYPAAENIMPARLALAQSLTSDKKYDEALKLWEQLEKAPATRDKALAGQVLVYKLQEKKDKMVATMEKLGGGELKTPMQARGAMQLAVYYADLDKPDDSLRVLNKVLGKPEIIDSLVPVNATAIKLGDAFAEKKRYADAIRTYRWVKPRSVVIQYSKDRVSLLEQRKMANMANVAGNPQAVAQANLQNREIDGMIADTQGQLAEFEKLPDFAGVLLFRQARCWYEWEKKWEAIVCYDRMLQLFPQAEEAEQAMYGIVLSYADLNNASFTQEACERYLEKFPSGANSGTVGYLSGAVSLQNGDPATAEKFFGIMLEKQADSPYREDMLMLLGHARFSQGQWDNAKKDYEKYLQQYPSGSNKEEVSYRLATIEVFSGRYEEALKKLDVYLTAFPKGEYAQDAKYRIAVCYYAAREFDDVIKKCEAWLTEFPKDPMIGEVNSLLGDAYAALNKHPEAASAYERAVKAATTDEVLVYSLFEASKQMQKVGQWERLTSMFQEFTAANPEHQAAVAGMYWIGRAKAKLGRVDEAKSFLLDQFRKYYNEPKREAVEGLAQQIAQLCLKRPSAPPPPPAAAKPVAPAAPATPVAVNQPAAAEVTGALATPVVAAAGAPALAPVTTEPEPAPWDPFAEYDRLMNPLLEGAAPIGKARILLGKGELYELRRLPDKKQEILGQIARDFQPADLSPVLLGKIGDYLFEHGEIERATVMYDRLRTDFLRSEYLDYAYTGLGQIALRAKEYDKALEHFTTALDKIGAVYKIKDATIGKAQALLELGKFEESKKLFGEVASIKEWRGDATALAVYSLGEIEARQGRYPEAIAYYRRVFVAYQKYVTWVARAHLAAARTFDKANKRADGIDQLKDMLRNEKLLSLPEAEEARKLLQKWESA
jgi:tetratricopeptide (TPR) repeat protein